MFWDNFSYFYCDTPVPPKWPIKSIIFLTKWLLVCWPVWPGQIPVHSVLDTSHRIPSEMYILTHKTYFSCCFSDCNRQYLQSPIKVIRILFTSLRRIFKSWFVLCVRHKKTTLAILLTTFTIENSCFFIDYRPPQNQSNQSGDERITECVFCYQVVDVILF